MRRKSSKLLTTYTRYNKVKLIHGGSEYFNLLESLIDAAQHSIHVQVYIFEEDNTGKRILEALLRAAQRNVKVYLLFDGYASRAISKEFIKRVRLAQIYFRMFEPIFQTRHFYFGRRLHHKIFVADAYYSLVGGINISDRYNDVGDHPAWLDFALYAEGEISEELMKLCVMMWAKSGTTERKIFSHEKLDLRTQKNECMVRLRRNDWVQRKIQISKSYIEMLRHASSHITIMSSYFLPGNFLKEHLRRAAKRKVKIKVILASTSDVGTAKHAERYIYRWLFKHNIEIYEYQKTVLHGKIGTYDNKWATIGSYNFNYLSAYASIELNLDVNDAQFATQTNKELEKIIAEDCIQITEEHYRTNYNIFNRVVQRFSYELIRLVFFLFTFFYKQR